MNPIEIYDYSAPPLKAGALCLAAEGAHDEMVEYLLSVGANTTLKVCRHETRTSPLPLAAKVGSLEIVEKLIRAGVDVNAYGALHAASANGHLDIVQRLLDAGALVGCYSNSLKPLHEAASGGFLSVVKVLLQAGADLDALGRKCIPKGIFRSITALHMAAERADLEMVRALLAAGSDANVLDRHEGETALQAACKQGDIEMVHMLLEDGANPLPPLVAEDSLPLTLAAEGGHLSVVDRLLRTDGSLPRLPALHAATRNGHKDTVELLLKDGFPAYDGMDGVGLVTRAASDGHTSLVRLFFPLVLELMASTPKILTGTNVHCKLLWKEATL